MKFIYVIFPLSSEAFIAAQLEAENFGDDTFLVILPSVSPLAILAVRQISYVVGS